MELSRKEEYAQATRAALLEAALDLFIRKGYVRTTIEDISTQARVTRGAFYHHFAGKEQAFEILYENLARQLVARVRAAMEGVDDPWDRTRASLTAFLDYCLDPGIKSMRLSEAIGVLGWEKWRRLDSRHTMGLIRELIEGLREAGHISAGPVDVLADLLYALYVEAALVVVRAKKKKQARDDLETVIGRMMGGLRN